MSTLVDERVSDEVQALQAILLNDVLIKSVDDVPLSIETVVHPSTGDVADQQFVCITLEVTLTPDYPDSSPEVTLRNPRGLDDSLLSSINTQISEKLKGCLGHPVVFELIELIKENLTESNLPSGQCVICLYGFAEGDVFIKTQCYHYFHNYCLASHLIAGERNYYEELEKLPQWQRALEAPYQQTCPVCRSVVSCDVDTLKQAMPPIESVSAPPFHLTAELKALQLQMAALLAEQVAKGGVVGEGDTGPPPLTITTPSDSQNESTNGAASTPTSETNRPPESLNNTQQNGHSSNEGASPRSPAPRQAYRGPYRGFNRRGKPGRSRGRGAPR